MLTIQLDVEITSRGLLGGNGDDLLSSLGLGSGSRYLPHQGRPNGSNKYLSGQYEGDDELVAVDGNAEITKRHFDHGHSANTDIEAELEASIKAKEEDNAKVDVDVSANANANADAKAEVEVGDKFNKRFHRFGEINNKHYHHNHDDGVDVDADAKVDVNIRARGGLIDLIEASAKVSSNLYSSSFLFLPTLF